MNQVKLPLTVILLGLTAFLLPIIGGNLYFFEYTRLESGYASFMLAVFWGREAPAAANLIAVLGALATIVIIATRRRVLLIPDTRLAISLGLFFFLIVASVAASSYHLTSLSACANWLAYGLVFFAAASGSGRVRGPVAILSALAAGCSLSALMGISEWLQTVRADPTWRIFADWQNPNALAGMLMLGFVVSLGLLAISRGRAALLYGLAVALNGIALFLTQSRGGLIAAVVGTACLLVYVVLRRKAIPSQAIFRMGLSLAVAALLCGGAIGWSHSLGGTVGGRLTGSTASTQESNGFRKLLWKGAVETIKHDPIGSGIGTYVYTSTRSGLTDQTFLAHNSLLQLGVEATIVTPLAFLAVVAFWARSALSGRRIDSEAAVLRVAVVAAVLASLIDGLVDSNMYFFGIGATVFLLLGLGLQLGADGVSPEFAPPPMRRSLVAGAIMVAGVMGYTAYCETVKAHAWYDLATPSPMQTDDLTADLGAVKTIAGGDGEAHELLAHDPTLSNDARIAELKLADQLEPTSKHARELSDMEVTAGHPGEAVAALNQALENDPFNLLDLDRLLKLQRDSGQTDGAIKTATKIVSVESRPIFTDRAISEVVPLSTAKARAYLASQEQNPAKLDELLEGAVKVYLEYADKTIPYLSKMWGPTGQGPTSMPNKEDAIAGLTEGRDIAKALAVAYKNQGRLADEERTESAVAKLSATLDGLGGDK